MSMKLSVITLTYNKLEYTKKYIDSLYQYTNDFELILVDNGSNDGTVAYIKSLPYTNIKTVYNGTNLGFSEGNNQGIELAEGEYIAFLNNDILLCPNWFEECENVFKKEKTAAFVSPYHLNPHYDKVNENNYLKHFKNLDFDSLYSKSFDKCEFSCVITKREIIDKLGIFDTNYSPAFFEDNDFKYRAIEAGYDTYFITSACFFHFGSVTSEKLNHNFEKNKEYYFSKHRFGEYLSLYSTENSEYRFRTRYFMKFPFNYIYAFHLFYEKVLRNLKRIIHK